MLPEEKLNKAQDITNRINTTSNADFVRRLKQYPSGPKLIGADGKDVTHKMSYATEDGKDIIYPEVQYIDGKLVNFSSLPDWRVGYNSAVLRGDTIQVGPGMGEVWTSEYKHTYPNFNYLEYIEEDKNGAKIHIKESHKGRFTEYCGGKVTNECIARGKASKDPKVRKMATFAQNARKWN